MYVCCLEITRAFDADRSQTEIHKKTGIPYSEMVRARYLLFQWHPSDHHAQLFFDDEARNKETESLG